MNVTLPTSIKVPAFENFLKEFQSYPEINATIAMHLALLSTTAQFELADAKRLLYKEKERMDTDAKRIFSTEKLKHEAKADGIREAKARESEAYVNSVNAAAEVNADYDYVTDLFELCEQLHYYFKDIYKTDQRVGQDDTHQI